MRCLLFLLCALSHGAEGRWITVEATAYCPCELCCEGSADGITADGTRTMDAPYGIASSPNLALGSIVFLPSGAGYLDATYPRDSQRLFRIDDRGGSLRTDWRRTGITRLDLRYKNHWSAKQFGRKLLVVYVQEAK